MKSCIFLAVVAVGCVASSVVAHDIREVRSDAKSAKLVAQAEAALPPAAVPGVTGQSPYRFRLFRGSEILPPEAQEVLVRAHGGFAVDRREGRGEIYFALPGAGILQIASDLKSVRLIETDAEMRDTNMHNAKIWFAEDGRGFLAFPGNDVSKVFTTTMEGKLVSVLDSPPAEAAGFEEPKVNEYFAKGGRFVPTDVEQLDGWYYITTGYSALDYVLTAKIESTSPFKVQWNDLAFGGKGKEPGQFGTGHGITVPPGTKQLDVADRPNSEIDRFSKYGQYRSTVSLPAGSLPCDVDFEGELQVIGCLEGPDKSKGAPIYIVKGGEVVSTLMPKEELGLEKFKHVHNATLITVGGRLYVIAQAWNPGDFAIFEQVVD